MFENLNKNMSKFTVTIAIFFLFFIVNLVSGQTLKTDEGRRLKIVERQVVILESELSNKNAELKVLLKKYSPDYFGVHAVKESIEIIEKSLASYYAEKKELLTKKLVVTLPNTQTELLKILILQNEKIIELLEKQQNP